MSSSSMISETQRSTSSRPQELLYVIDERDIKTAGSIIFTSQIPTKKWRQIFGEPTVGEAALDRIVHQAIELEVKGESRRKPVAAR